MIQPWKLARYVTAGCVPGGRCQCVICGRRIWRFMPYRSGIRGVPKLMRTLEMVGSNPDRFECPRCGSHDRERHLFLYMQTSGLLKAMRGASILHFAPEKHLPRILREVGASKYIKADLFPGKPDVVRVDMLDMPFADDSFDMVIANHVLEHVPDTARALSEIRRVLKPSAHAILQTPYSRKLHRTWEDTGIDTAEARLQAYGQEDHMRLFGHDIFERIVAAGFKSCVRQHDELLADIDPVAMGVNPAEPFFHYQKS